MAQSFLFKAYPAHEEPIIHLLQKAAYYSKIIHEYLACIRDRSVDIDDRYMNISDRDIDVMFENIDAIVQS